MRFSYRYMYCVLRCCDHWPSHLLLGNGLQFYLCALKITYVNHETQEFHSNFKFSTYLGVIRFHLETIIKMWYVKKKKEEAATAHLFNGADIYCQQYKKMRENKKCFQRSEHSIFCFLFFVFLYVLDSPFVVSRPQNTYKIRLWIDQSLFLSFEIYTQLIILWHDLKRWLKLTQMDFLRFV